MEDAKEAVTEDVLADGAVDGAADVAEDATAGLVPDSVRDPVPDFPADFVPVAADRPHGVRLARFASGALYAADVLVPRDCERFFFEVRAEPRACGCGAADHAVCLAYARVVAPDAQLPRAAGLVLRAAPGPHGRLRFDAAHARDAERRFFAQRASYYRVLRPMLAHAGRRKFAGLLLDQPAARLTPTLDADLLVRRRGIHDRVDPQAAAAAAAASLDRAARARFEALVRAELALAQREAGKSHELAPLESALGFVPCLLVSGCTAGLSVSFGVRPDRPFKFDVERYLAADDEPPSARFAAAVSPAVVGAAIAAHLTRYGLGDGARQPMRAIGAALRARKLGTLERLLLPYMPAVGARFYAFWAGFEHEGGGRDPAKRVLRATKKVHKAVEFADEATRGTLELLLFDLIVPSGRAGYTHSDVTDLVSESALLAAIAAVVDSPSALLTAVETVQKSAFSSVRAAPLAAHLDIYNALFKNPAEPRPPVGARGWMDSRVWFQPMRVSDPASGVPQAPVELGPPD